MIKQKTNVQNKHDIKIKFCAWFALSNCRFSADEI